MYVTFLSFIFFIEQLHQPVAARSSTLNLLPLTLRGGSSAPDIELSSLIEMDMMDTKTDKDEANILMVFSDLDGTLLHYPEKIPTKSPNGNKLLKLPPSSTGMRAVISSKTLAQIQEIRRQKIKLILVSGMRTTTLMNRLPYLPRADAYCSEAGGRIFYPTTTLSDDTFPVKPQNYDGASDEDLSPFGLIEDVEWKHRMEQRCGQIGSVSLKDIAANPKKLESIHERDGLLWDFARDLVSKGYVLDVNGYSASFRVNQKQQPTSVSEDDFEKLLDGRIPPWDGLATSINLNCVDFYPMESGKKNWYVM
jgi:hypothetical protein